jgi:hypothetical protein
VAEIAPKYGLKTLAGLEGQLVTLDTGTATLPRTCPCRRGGLGWWDVVQQVNTDLVICPRCNNQWRRETPAGGYQQWTFYPRFVIQEQP